MHIIVASQYLILESAVLRVFADIIDLVDNCSRTRILVNENASNQMFVRMIRLSKVQVNYVANLREARRNLGVQIDG